MTADAIRASYVDFKLVKTRSQAQLILEVPIEQAEAALDLLGIPQPGKPTWCAIARLNDSAAGPLAPLRPDRALPADGDVPPEAGSGAAGRPALSPGEKLVQMAGILCNDERFQKWVCEIVESENDLSFSHEYSEKLAAFEVRTYCQIQSRRELATNPEAAAKFEALVDRYKSETGQATEKRG